MEGVLEGLGPTAVHKVLAGVAEDADFVGIRMVGAFFSNGK